MKFVIIVAIAFVLGIGITLPVQAQECSNTDFQLIINIGEVKDDNYSLIASYNEYDNVKRYFTKKFKPYVIGKISKGKNKVKLNGSINWI